jgi:hypothetical protein
MPTFRFLYDERAGKATFINLSQIAVAELEQGTLTLRMSDGGTLILPASSGANSLIRELFSNSDVTLELKAKIVEACLGSERVT